jgi:hypothetical protein
MTLIVRRVTTSARSTALAVRLTGNRIGQVAVRRHRNRGRQSRRWFGLLALGALLTASALAIQRRAPDGATADDVDIGVNNDAA